MATSATFLSDLVGRCCRLIVTRGARSNRVAADDGESVERVHRAGDPADRGQLLVIENPSSLGVVLLLRPRIRKGRQGLGQGEGSALRNGEECGVPPRRQYGEPLRGLRAE